MNDDQKKEIMEDATEARRKRVEPVVKKILEEMLKADLLLADKRYLHACVKEQFFVLAQNFVFMHLNEVFDMIDSSLTHAFNDATKGDWNGKDPDQISLKEIDEKLEVQGKKIPDEK